VTTTTRFRVPNCDQTANRRRGVLHPKAELGPAAVGAIRIKYRAGATVRHIAGDLGVHPTTLHRVLTGRTWSHVPDPLGPIRMRRAAPGSGREALP
jgi:hypothetical protein